MIGCIVLDGPGYEPADGKLEIESDDVAFSFGLSALYEFTDKTRVGLVYKSENDNTMSGDAKFSGLGPNTETFLDNAGLLNASVDNSSVWPQSLSAGLFHEFDNRSAVTLDVSWLDVSEFVLTETYVNGDLVLEHDIDYDDVWTVGGSYSRPLGDKWMVAAGILRVSDMVSDNDRSMILRLDDIWIYGLGVEYMWKPNRKIVATFDYIDMGDAPVSTPDSTIGAVSGRYTERDIYLLRIAMEFGNGPR
jgi:long-chain fatty acid transport protein